MDFNSIVVTLLAIIYEINAEKYTASDFVVPKNCTEIQTVRTQKYVPYQVTDISTDGFVEKSKTKTKYRYENVEFNQSKAICCDGYQNYDEKQCIPVCTKSCGSEGICFSPGNCVCNEGYSIDSISKKCKPDCSLECINGFCMSPDLCSCNEGYYMTDDNHTCKPLCKNGTETCTDLEICAEPGVCRCIEGYARDTLDRQLGSDEIDACKPICDRTCIHGDCVSPNVCQCHENYTRVDEFTCERFYVASDFAISKNCTETKPIKTKVQVPYEETYLAQGGGYDYDRNYYRERYRGPIYQTRTQYKTEYSVVNQTTSICCDGYQNYDDQNCLPVCSRSCGPHGICSKPDVCICNEGYSMDQLGNCVPTCQAVCVNGQCTSPNYCTCNKGYHKISYDHICEPIFVGDYLEDVSDYEYLKKKLRL